MERVTGIEPALSAWKAEALPLSYTRAAKSACTTSTNGNVTGKPPSCEMRAVTRYDYLLARGVAQLGSASALGAEGRGFKSRHPDTLARSLSLLAFLFPAKTPTR